MKVSLEMNPYLLGCMVLMVFWLTTLILLKTRRLAHDIREFWWASASCCVLGVTEPLFVPEYWIPPSILSFHRWDIESFVFCFAVGGISSVLAELPGVKGILVRTDYFLWRAVRTVLIVGKRCLLGTPDVANMAIISYSPLIAPSQIRLENMVLITFFLATFGATAQLNLNIIYDAAIVSAGTALFVWWRRPKLRWQIVGGGLSFTLIYTVVLTVVVLYSPDFYVEHWQLDSLSGLWMLGAPVEEYLFSFTFGALWAPLYEAWKEERSSSPAIRRDFRMRENQ